MIGNGLLLLSLITFYSTLFQSVASAEPLPQQSGKVDLANTTHVNIQMNGAAVGDKVGWSIAGAADINDDGLGDFVVGSPCSTSVGIKNSGAAFIVFAKRPSSRTRNVDLASIGAVGNSDGFRINGPPSVNPDYCVSSDPVSWLPAGWAVASGGDVDNDGHDDILISSPTIDENAIGSVWLVRGKSSYDSVNLVDIGSSGNKQGVRINGINKLDLAGFSLNIIGDLNSDHMDEIAIGVPGADFNGREASGSVYIVYGRQNNYTTINLSQIGDSGGQGFRIDGAAAADKDKLDGIGRTVADIPDMNGDHATEIAVATPHTGNTYVVFGQRTANLIDLKLIGADKNTQGFAINGFADPKAALSLSGVADMNGDGRGEVVVGYKGADNNGADSGSSYVLFGKPGYAAESLASIGQSGSEGFRVDGAGAKDWAGASVQGCGDVNDDGRADLVIGAPHAPGYQRQRSESGAAYVVFGRASSSTTSIPLTSIGSPGNTDGFLIDGATNGNHTGASVSCAGDANGDEHSDVLLGAPDAQLKGAAYVLFGFGNSSVSYEPSVVTGYLGESVPSLWPKVDRTGDANFSIWPPLQSNLTFDTRTGLIAGSPKVEQPPTQYTVTMTDLTGSVSTTVTIEVVPARGLDLLKQANIEIDGATQADQSGLSVAGAGDVNGDHIDDVIIGAPLTDSKGLKDAGAAYVIYGQGHAMQIDLAQIGTRGNHDGFLIQGASILDEAGSVVAGAGDTDGDGLKDVMVGSSLASRPGGKGEAAGTAYIIYGSSKMPYATIDLAEIGAKGNTKGLKIIGAHAADNAGASVAGAGDLNNDKKSEVIIGAPNSRVSGRDGAGKVYVVWGKHRKTRNTLDLNSNKSSAFFTIAGATSGDYAGSSVASTEDINGDGINEIVVGAPRASNRVGQNSGVVYVLWGKASNVSVDLSKLGSSGIRIFGAAAGELTGASVSSAPDMNGDRKPEIIVGAPSAGNTGMTSGSAYVVFGTQFDIFLASMAHGQGFRIDGANQGDKTGYSVDGVADQNGDGLGDLLVGAPYSDSRHGENAGSAYLVYGKPTFDIVNLNDAGSHALKIDGPVAGSQAGISVSDAGDFGGDNFPDILIGANLAPMNARVGSGSSYLIYNKSQQ